MPPYLTIIGLAIACSVAAFGLLLVARNIFNLFMWVVYFFKEWLGRYEYGKYHWWFNPNPRKKANRK